MIQVWNENDAQFTCLIVGCRQNLRQDSGLTRPVLERQVFAL